MSKQWDFTSRHRKVTPAMLAACSGLSDDLIAFATAARARLAAIPDDDDDTATAQQLAEAA